MNSVQWDSISGLVDVNIDEATNKFENIFSDIINKNAPIREIRVSKPVSASWMTDEIIF